MNKHFLISLAVLSILAPLTASRAEDQKQLLSEGLPTMAYRVKDRIIYYDYSKVAKPDWYHSSILASNPVYAHSHYMTPTMAYYLKDKIIYYAFTNRPVGRYDSHADLLDFERPFHRTSVSVKEMNLLVQSAGLQPQETERAADPAPAHPLRTLPASVRQAFEEEDALTIGSEAGNAAAIASVPVDAAGYYKRANAYRECGEYGKAIQDYNEVTRLDPENPYAFYKRGLCYSAIRLPGKAVENFQMAAELMIERKKL